MAQTLREFLVECDNYEYSKEHYELMKECAELALMEQYIADQEFLMYTTESFSEGYLMEAASMYQLDAIYEEAETKKKNIFQRFWDWLVRIVKVIKRFFTNLFNKFKRVSDKAKAKVDEYLNKRDDDDDYASTAGETQLREAREARREARREEREARREERRERKDVHRIIKEFAASHPVVHRVIINNKVPAKIKMRERYGILEAKCRMLIEDSFVVNPGSDNEAAINLNDLINVLIGLWSIFEVEQKGMNNDQIKECYRMIESAHNADMKSGITIEVNDKLKRLLDDFDTEYGKIGINQNNYPTDTEIGDVNTLMATVSNLSSNTIKLYTDCVKARNDLLKMTDAY